MIESSLRRALAALRLCILAVVANLSAFTVPAGVYFVMSAPAAAAAEQPSRTTSAANTSQRADRGDDEEKTSSTDDDDDDDDENSDDGCGDDGEEDDTEHEGRTAPGSLRDATCAALLSANGQNKPSCDDVVRPRRTWR